MLTLQATQHPRAIVIQVSGRMDAENSPQFEQECNIWSTGGNYTLIADCSGLQYVSSMGLRSFLSVAQSLKKNGGALHLAGLTGLPKNVFEMTRLLPLFPVHPDTETALLSI